MDKQTGGPAFPIGATPEEWGNGMTLRDYFATKAPISINDAMVTLFLDSNFGTLAASRRAEVMARLSELRFEYADAMLAERAQ